MITFAPVLLACLGWTSAAAAPEPAAGGSPVGLYAAVGGAIDRTALAASLGGRYLVSPAWLVGLDAEWNPWASFQTKTLQAGVVNLYVTAVRRFRIKEDIALRTTVHAGVSVLLFDLYGAPRGSRGPYVGINLLGIEFGLGGPWTLVLDPADVAFAVPHVTGAPLMYRQYRLTVGLQWGGSR